MYTYFLTLTTHMHAHVQTHTYNDNIKMIITLNKNEISYKIIFLRNRIYGTTICMWDARVKTADS